MCIGTLLIGDLIFVGLSKVVLMPALEREPRDKTHVNSRVWRYRSECGVTEWLGGRGEIIFMSFTGLFIRKSKIMCSSV